MSSALTMVRSEDRTTASHALDLTWICCMEGERENNWAGMDGPDSASRPVNQSVQVSGWWKERNTLGISKVNGMLVIVQSRIHR